MSTVPKLTSCTSHNIPFSSPPNLPSIPPPFAPPHRPKPQPLSHPIIPPPTPPPHVPHIPTHKPPLPHHFHYTRRISATHICPQPNINPRIEQIPHWTHPTSQRRI